MRQYCSRPFSQFPQTPQESTRQPIAARSPALKFLTAEPNFSHPTHNLMTRNDGVISHTPVVVNKVNVGVADPTMFDCNLNIVGSDWTAFDVQVGTTRALGSDAE